MTAIFKFSVRHHMSAPAHFVSPSDLLSAVHRRFADLHISCFAVLAKQDLVGVISHTDLLRAGRPELRGDSRLLTFGDKRVEDVMTSPVETVASNDSMMRAAQKMTAASIHRVFVLDVGRLVGVFGTRDLMRVVSETNVQTPIEDLMSTPVITVEATDSIAVATERLSGAHVTGLIVVEDDWPVGVFTQFDALAARHVLGTSPVEQVMDVRTICMSVSTRLHRAAAQATRMKVRRIIAVAQRHMKGVLSGLDFARFVAGSGG